MSHRCPKCGFEEEHYNDESNLPPVGCYIFILVGDKLLKVRRDTYLSSSSNLIKYIDTSGNTITGRFKWRYC